MSSPQRPAPSDPTVDPALPTIEPRLLELDGRAYKDRSLPAAAQRAAYYRARAARSLSSLGRVAPAGQALVAADAVGIGNHYADFANFGTSADWTPEYGTQEAGGEGWIMHSQGDTSSRMVFNYPVNDGSSPHTMVRVWMRGALGHSSRWCADRAALRHLVRLQTRTYDVRAAWLRRPVAGQPKAADQPAGAGVEFHRPGGRAGRGARPGGRLPAGYADRGGRCRQDPARAAGRGWSR